MTLVLVSQRVVIDDTTGERRDSLDQSWAAFLDACDVTPVGVPNSLAAAQRVVDQLPWSGVLLTGGNDLASHGGDAPERDEVERFLVERALAAGRPVVGVCRGMQMLLARAGAEIVPVEGHVADRASVLVRGVPRVVNSFHRFGCFDAPQEFEVWAVAADGVVEAVRHVGAALVGIMWHPERLAPFADEDIALFRATFGVRRGLPTAR